MLTPRHIYTILKEAIELEVIPERYGSIRYQKNNIEIYAATHKEEYWNDIPYTRIRISILKDGKEDLLVCDHKTIFRQKKPLKWIHEGAWQETVAQILDTISSQTQHKKDKNEQKVDLYNGKFRLLNVLKK